MKAGADGEVDAGAEADAEAGPTTIVRGTYATTSYIAFNVNVTSIVLRII